MLKPIVMFILMACITGLFAGQEITNPCAKNDDQCQFTTTTPDGVTFTLLTDKTRGSYITFKTASGETKPMQIDYIDHAKFYLTCPDLLEEIVPGFGNPTDSWFIDLKTHTLLNIVPDVFAVNCDKRVVAYENDTVHDGSLFVSPIANLYQVINLDSYIHTDQPYAVQRTNSHFDDQGNLAITYMRESGGPGTLIYTKTSITIPINYNDFVHSDQIDHSRSDDVSQLGN